MFTRSLIKGGGRLATTRSLVNNSTSLVLKNQFKKYSTSTPPKVAKSKSSTIGKIFRYTFYTAVISVIGSAGLIGYKIYEESQPVDQVKQTPLFPNGEKKKTLVILGSGWGAISLLKNLDTTLYNVVIVSPRNYFLFTPLLPSVPTGTVELRSIIEPVRSVTRRCPGQVIYLEAEATNINPKTNELTLKQSTTVVYGHSGKDKSSYKTTVSE